MNIKNFGFYITDIKRLMTREFFKRDQSLTPMEVRALLYVARFEGIRQRELADRLDIQPIALVRLIDQLARDSLVERRPDPNDRRAYCLYLCEDTASIVEDLRKEVDDINRQALSALTAKEAEQLMSLMEKVHASISERSEK